MTEVTAYHTEHHNQFDLIYAQTLIAGPSGLQLPSVVSPDGISWSVSAGSHLSGAPGSIVESLLEAFSYGQNTEDTLSAGLGSVVEPAFATLADDAYTFAASTLTTVGNTIHLVWQGYIEEWVVSGYENLACGLEWSWNVGTAFGLGLLQGGANMANGVQDVLADAWVGGVGMFGGRAGDGVDQTFDFVTGLGDSLSCGLGEGLRWLTGNDHTNYDSTGYKAGSWAGVAIDCIFIVKGVGKFTISQGAKLLGRTSDDIAKQAGRQLAPKTGLPGAGPIPRSLRAMSQAEKPARKFKLNVNSPTTQQVLNSLGDSVSTFVGKYRQGKILKELPSEVLDMSIEDALSHSTKVRKLLIAGRFVK